MFCSPYFWPFSCVLVKCHWIHSRLPGSLWLLQTPWFFPRLPELTEQFQLVVWHIISWFSFLYKAVFLALNLIYSSCSLLFKGNLYLTVNWVMMPFSLLWQTRTSCSSKGHDMKRKSHYASKWCGFLLIL